MVKSIVLGIKYSILCTLQIFFLNLISANESLLVDYEIDNLNGQTVNVCQGNFTDAGGLASNYSNNENYTVTFCSDNGEHITFNFSNFDVESNYDFFYVYDGETTAATQLAGSPYSGFANLSGPITSSGTCFTFQFVSDNQGSRLGWAAAISCTSESQTQANACSSNMVVNSSFEEQCNNCSPPSPWTVTNGFGYQYNDPNITEPDGDAYGYVSPGGGGLGLMHQEFNISNLTDYPVGTLFDLYFYTGSHNPDGTQSIELRQYNNAGTEVGTAAIHNIIFDVDNGNLLGGPYNLFVTKVSGATSIRVIMRAETDYAKLDAVCLRGILPCEEITNISPRNLEICTGEIIPNLTIETNNSSNNGIEFVYFSNPQPAGDMYSGGTSLGFDTPVGGFANISNINLPANNGITPETYYVYAILNPAPSEPECRPYQEAQVIINPDPLISPTFNTPCIGSQWDFTANPTGGSGVYTYFWSGANGWNSTDENPIIPVANATYNPITVTITDDLGCSQTISNITAPLENCCPAQLCLPVSVQIYSN